MGLRAEMAASEEQKTYFPLLEIETRFLSFSQSISKGNVNNNLYFAL
jgi:hypothetical protein